MSRDDPILRKNNEGASRSSRLTPRQDWLRGLDLNQRPLGYEGNSSREASRSDPNGDKGVYDLRDYPLGRLRATSVPLLHSSFIARRGQTPCSKRDATLEPKVGTEGGQRLA